MKTKIIAHTTAFMTIGAAILMTGCSSKDAVPEPIVGKCIISGIVGPEWACGAYEDDNTLAAAGSAQISKLGYGFTRREAIASARATLAQ